MNTTSDSPNEQVLRSRRYKLTRLEPGDYLLLSNDAKTLWRIADYNEWGSLEIDGKPITGRFWELFRRPAPARTQPIIDVIDWSGWKFWSGLHSTRNEALAAALRE